MSNEHEKWSIILKKAHALKIGQQKITIFNLIYYILLGSIITGLLINVH